MKGQQRDIFFGVPAGDFITGCNDCSVISNQSRGLTAALHSDNKVRIRIENGGI